MSVNDLERELWQFSGTDAYHRWSGLFQNCYLTDGAEYLAEKAKAYWLMDAIASYQTKLRDEPFQVWALTVTANRKATLICTDGNEKVLAEQQIPYTDFPLPSIKLYATWSELYGTKGGHLAVESILVIMLQSEY